MKKNNPLNINQSSNAVDTRASSVHSEVYPHSLTVLSGRADTRIFSAHIQIADTDRLRQLGLSHRDSLGLDQGLLFIFPTTGTYAFWMKDMKFPIDILWIDSNKKIIHIEHSLAPDTYPRTFAPQKPAQYVLEINAGLSKKYSINIGDRVEF